MLEYQINVERFNEAFPLKVRELIESFVRDSVKGVEKRYPSFYKGYWGTLGTAFGRYQDLPQGIHVLDDLFPPNIAVLDWLLDKNFGKDTVIADIPCGLGNLMCYLGWLFNEVWGYDKWTQIEKERAERLLEWGGFPECLVDLPTILAKPIDILISMALPFDWIAEDVAPIIAKAKYILVDTSYLPKIPEFGVIEGFEVIGCYPKLLNVYQRKELQ